MKKLFHKDPNTILTVYTERHQYGVWEVTGEERRLTKKKYERKLQNDQLLKITAVTVMHGTCMFIYTHAGV